MKIGTATYLLGIHFSETSHQTLEDRLKKLIRNEVLGNVSVSA